MANEEQLSILMKGVDAWNKWREEHPDIAIDPSAEREQLKEADLRGANLSKAHLWLTDFKGTDFRRANLEKAEFWGANLTEANLSRTGLSRHKIFTPWLSGAKLMEADLQGTNLSGAVLSGADLSGAVLKETNLGGAVLKESNLSGADLRGADLCEAILNGTRLSGANISEAGIGSTLFNDIDLGQVSGLDKVRHISPSSIGIESIYKSKGKIPEAFLSGCGVPENLITFIRSLTGKAFDFYSCFISYSSKDQEFAKRIYADLQNKGVRCWFAPEVLKIGDKFRTRIDEAIRLHDKLLLVLSQNSIQSDWVEKEVETAFEKERQQRRTMLFPVQIDDSVMSCPQAWAADIRRTRHIGDMTRWKEHDQYQKAFERLLRDLKAEPS